MALANPQSTDPLDSPDHALQHRICGIDLSSPEQMIVVNNLGNFIISGSGIVNNGLVINESGGSAEVNDFRVESNSEDELILVDSSEDWVRLGGGNNNYFQITYTGSMTYTGAARFPMYHKFHPAQARFPATNPATSDGSETNYRLLFDDTTDESCYWQDAVHHYAGGTLYADIFYSTSSTNTDKDVVFEVSIMAVTDGDSADINTESYDTLNYVKDRAPNTAGYMGKATVTLTNKDNISAGDYFKIKLARDADNTNDTDNVVGDIEVIYMIVRE